MRYIPIRLHWVGGNDYRFVGLTRGVLLGNVVVTNVDGGAIASPPARPFGLCEQPPAATQASHWTKVTSRLTHLKGRYGDAVNGFLVVTSIVGAHLEAATGNKDHFAGEFYRL